MASDIIFGSFVWDQAKEQINIARHGLSFSEAAFAFLDPQRLLLEDIEHSAREIRFFCIGMVNDKVATVRFTRRGDQIRIIGAGYWRKWRKVYEENQTLRRR